jgi:hypothetical protein
LRQIIHTDFPLFIQQGNNGMTSLLRVSFHTNSFNV